MLFGRKKEEARPQSNKNPEVSKYIGLKSRCTITWENPIDNDLGTIENISYDANDYIKYGQTRVDGIWKVKYSGGAYEGELSEGRRDGVGSLVTSEGDGKYSKYKGYFRMDDLFDGEVKVIFNGVGVLEGRVEYGKFVQGSFEFINGDIQKGQWKNGLQNGNCMTALFSKDILWEGEFVNGMPCGKCVMYKPNSHLEEFRGTFKDPGNAVGDYYIWKNGEWEWDCRAELVNGELIKHKGAGTTISRSQPRSVRETMRPEHLMTFQEKQCLDQ